MITILTWCPMESILWDLIHNFTLVHQQTTNNSVSSTGLNRTESDNSAVFRVTLVTVDSI